MRSAGRAGCGEGEGFSGAAGAAGSSVPHSPLGLGAWRAEQELSPSEGASVPIPAPIPSGAPRTVNTSWGHRDGSGCWDFAFPGSSTVEAGVGGLAQVRRELEPANQEDELSHPAPGPS